MIKAVCNALKWVSAYILSGKRPGRAARKRKSFEPLFSFLEKNKFEIAGDVLLLPTYLNLDGCGNSIEILYVPIKKYLTLNSVYTLK